MTAQGNGRRGISWGAVSFVKRSQVGPMERAPEAMWSAARPGTALRDTVLRPECGGSSVSPGRGCSPGTCHSAPEGAPAGRRGGPGGSCRKPPPVLREASPGESVAATGEAPRAPRHRGGLAAPRRSHGSRKPTLPAALAGSREEDLRDTRGCRLARSRLRRRSTGLGRPAGREPGRGCARRVRAGARGAAGAVRARGELEVRFLPLQPWNRRGFPEKSASRSGLTCNPVT